MTVLGIMANIAPVLRPCSLYFVLPFNSELM
jgi:hypothetical protein